MSKAGLGVLGALFGVEHTEEANKLLEQHGSKEAVETALDIERAKARRIEKRWCRVKLCRRYGKESKRAAFYPKRRRLLEKLDAQVTKQNETVALLSTARAIAVMRSS